MSLIQAMRQMRALNVAREEDRIGRVRALAGEQRARQWQMDTEQRGIEQRKSELEEQREYQERKKLESEQREANRVLAEAGQPLPEDADPASLAIQGQTDLRSRVLEVYRQRGLLETPVDQLRRVEEQFGAPGLEVVDRERRALGEQGAAISRATELTMSGGTPEQQRVRRQGRIDDATGYLAIEVINGADITDPKMIAEAAKTLSGMDPTISEKDWLDIVRNAAPGAIESAFDKIRQDRSATGTQERVQIISDKNRILRRKWGDDAIDAANLDYGGKEGDETIARMIINGQLAFDPVARFSTDKFRLIELPGDKIDNRNLLKSRVAMGEMRELFIAARDIHERMASMPPSERTLANVPGFTRELMDVASVWGINLGYDQAMYKNLSFEFVSLLLKARQGSRPSDFDFKMYLSLLPTIQEIGTDAARGKFDAMDRSMALSLNLAGDDTAFERATNEITKLRNIPMSAEDRAYEKQFNSLLTQATYLDDNGLFLETNEDARELMQRIENLHHEWGDAQKRRRPGKSAFDAWRLTPPASVVVDPADSKFEGELEELTGGQRPGTGL